MYWYGDTITNETLMCLDDGNRIGGFLQYDPVEILSVKSYDLEREFREKRHFIMDGNRFLIPASSPVPFLKESAPRGIDVPPPYKCVSEIKNIETDYVRLSPEVVWTEGTLFYGHQVCVTYRYRREQAKSDLFGEYGQAAPEFCRKTASGENVTVAIAGTYSVRVSFKRGSLSAWEPSDAVRPDTSSVTIYFVVAKKALEIPALTGSLPFNGEIQNFLPQGFDADFMEIVGDNTGKEVEKYSFAIALRNSENTEWVDGDGNKSSANLSVSWEIVKGKIVRPTVKNVSYSGKQIDFTAYLENYDSELTELSGELTAVNAGEYAFTVKIKEEYLGNYEWDGDGKTEIQLIFTVSKAKLSSDWDTSKPVPVFNVPDEYEGLLEIESVYYDENGAEVNENALERGKTYRIAVRLKKEFRNNFEFVGSYGGVLQTADQSEPIAFQNGKPPSAAERFFNGKFLFGLPVWGWFVILAVTVAFALLLTLLIVRGRKKRKRKILAEQAEKEEKERQRREEEERREQEREEKERRKREEEERREQEKIEREEERRRREEEREDERRRREEERRFQSMGGGFGGTGMYMQSLPQSAIPPQPTVPVDQAAQARIKELEERLREMEREAHEREIARYKEEAERARKEVQELEQKNRQKETELQYLRALQEAESRSRELMQSHDDRSALDRQRADERERLRLLEEQLQKQELELQAMTEALLKRFAVPRQPNSENES